MQFHSSDDIQLKRIVENVVYSGFNMTPKMYEILILKSDRDQLIQLWKEMKMNNIVPTYDSAIVLIQVFLSSKYPELSIEVLKTQVYLEL